MREVYALAALAQIENSDLLSAPHYRTARRLLDRVSANGELHIDHAEALGLCGTCSLGTLRAHLIALQSAGIIQYAINHQVHIGFLAWPVIATRANSRATRSNSRVGRANLIENSPEPNQHEPEEALTRAPDDQIRAWDARNRAPDDQICAPDARDGGIIGGLVGWDLPSPPSLEETNQPTPPPAPSLEGEPKPNTPVDHALALALLTAAGVAPVKAKAIADAFPLALIQRAVGYWWDRRETQFRSPGIIVYWFEHLEETGIPAELSPAFRRSALYRRHRTRAQIEADSGDAVLTYAPPAPPVHRRPPPADNPADNPLDALWADIVATRNPSQRLYLEGARLTALADGHAQIVTSARTVGWLNAQMSKAIERELLMRGHPASVIFVAEEGAP